MVIAGLLAAAALAVAAAACGGPTKEDRRRIDMLADDPMLHLDRPQLTPQGPVTTVVGHGDGPTLTQGEATRTYTSSRSPSELVQPLMDSAEAAGWEIQSSRDWGDRRYVTASRSRDGFGQGLDIHIAASPDGSEVRVVASAGAAAGEGSR